METRCLVLADGVPSLPKTLLEGRGLAHDALAEAVTDVRGREGEEAPVRTALVIDLDQRAERIEGDRADAVR